MQRVQSSICGLPHVDLLLPIPSIFLLRSLTSLPCFKPRTRSLQDPALLSCINLWEVLLSNAVATLLNTCLALLSCPPFMHPSDPALVNFRTQRFQLDQSLDTASDSAMVSSFLAAARKSTGSAAALKPPSAKGAQSNAKAREGGEGENSQRTPPTGSRLARAGPLVGRARCSRVPSALPSRS